MVASYSEHELVDPGLLLRPPEAWLPEVPLPSKSTMRCAPTVAQAALGSVRRDASAHFRQGRNCRPSVHGKIGIRRAVSAITPQAAMTRAKPRRIDHDMVGALPKLFPAAVTTTIPAS